MSDTLLYFFAFIVGSTVALQGPCGFKNVTLISGQSHKPIVTPSNCGSVTTNASELATKPNVILHSVNESREKDESYTFMLLEEIPQVRDTFKLRWLVSNITPLKRSLTSNESSVQFAKYTKPVADQTRSLKYFLYVYKQNKAAGRGLVGLAPNEADLFAPQQWVIRNKNIIQDIVGGVEFFVAPARAQSGYPNSHGGPVLPAMGSTIPQQPQYPSAPPMYNPSAQPGYPQPGHGQPGYPQPGHAQPGYPQPGYPQPGHAQPGYPQPGNAQPGNNQPTVINNFYGKEKDKDKKKKNSAASSLPGAILISLAAAAAILRL